jgi:hypothetical protein
VKVHHGNDLNLVANDPVDHRVGEAVENEAPSDARFDFGPALRRLENSADALFDCRFETLRGASVARQVPEERVSVSARSSGLPKDRPTRLA